MTSSAHSPFPDSPILEAELVRTEWGDYKATLILPDGQHETLSGDQLDAVRQRVIGVARGYLRTQVGHAGRLRVQDPDGTWLLGVPLENSDLIPLTATTISPPAAAAAAAATATTAAASGPPSRRSAHATRAARSASSPECHPAPSRAAPRAPRPTLHRRTPRRGRRAPVGARRPRRPRRGRPRLKPASRFPSRRRDAPVGEHQVGPHSSRDQVGHDLGHDARRASRPASAPATATATSHAGTPPRFGAGTPRDPSHGGPPLGRRRSRVVHLRAGFDLHAPSVHLHAPSVDLHPARVALQWWLERRSEPAWPQRRRPSAALTPQTVRTAVQLSKGT